GGLLLRSHATGTAEQGLLFAELEGSLRPRAADFNRRWDAVAAREKRSRTVIAQHTSDDTEGVKEREEARSAVGGPEVISRFVIDSVRLHGGAASDGGDGAHDLDVRHVPEALREAVGMETVKARFELPVRDDEVYLSRTHPFTEALASYVLDT